MVKLGFQVAELGFQVAELGFQVVSQSNSPIDLTFISHEHNRQEIWQFFHAVYSSPMFRKMEEEATWSEESKKLLKHLMLLI